MNYKKISNLVGLGLFITLCAPLTGVVVSTKDAELVALRICKNECSSKPENLVHWNAGEEFISLGIGHFIWYPENWHGPFDEQFPQFVQYCKNQGVALIPFLQEHTHCPWKDRASFLDSKNAQQVADLRAFLLQTQSLQAKFIAERLSKALVMMTAGLSEKQKKLITRRFDVLAATPQGLYGLIDYVNFKGEGTSPKERYNNEGWGLLQVLQEMSDEGDVLAEFRKSAKAVLARRVANSPPERNEGRWLQGWNNRIDTYKP